jgi:hypothetical protein
MTLGSKKVSDHFHYNGLWSFVRFLFNVSLTYILVLFTWLFFRATDFHTARVFLQKMIYWEPSAFTSRFVIITLAFSLMMLLFDALEYYTRSHTFLLKIKNRGVVVGILAALMLVSFLFMFQSEALPFIYFQF